MVRGLRRGKKILLVLHHSPPASGGISTSSVKMPLPGTSSLLIGRRAGVPACVPARGEVACSFCWVLLAQAGMTMTHIRQSRASTKS